MGVLDYLNRVNRELGGMGILPGLLARKIAAPEVEALEQEGVLQRQEIVRKAEARRRRKPVVLGAVTRPSPEQPTTPPTPVPPPPPPPMPSYDQRYVNFINNVNQGRQKKQAFVPQDLKDAISKVSIAKNVPPEILYALANKESNFRNIKENSGIGAQAGRGYFQIDRTYHPQVTDEQAYDPNFAASYAADLLNSRLNRYKTVTNAIRAYNGSVTNPTTRKYYEDYINFLGNYSY